MTHISPAMHSLVWQQTLCKRIFRAEDFLVEYFGRDEEVELSFEMNGFEKSTIDVVGGLVNFNL